MNQYKVEFSYMLTPDTTRRVTEEDTSTACTTQDAVDQVRAWYGDLAGFRVEQVWIDRNNRWEVTEAWE